MARALRQAVKASSACWASETARNVVTDPSGTARVIFRREHFQDFQVEPGPADPAVSGAPYIGRRTIVHNRHSCIPAMHFLQGR